ncbi:hypothetical protein MTO96_034628 [Rhipicephalus appendiculatus]
MFVSDATQEPSRACSVTPPDDLHEDAGTTAASVVSEPLTDACGTLCFLNTEVPDGVCADYFVIPDEDVVVYEELDNETITSSVSETDDTVIDIE